MAIGPTKEPVRPVEGPGEIAEPPSDEAVVGRVLDGDLAAFELLMRRNNQRVFRMVRSIVTDDDEAEDVVQDAYVRAFQNLSQYTGRAQFRTWLTRIAVNEALARKRRLQSLPLMDFSDPRNAASEPSMANSRPDDQACIQELGAVLSSVIDALPDDLRTVVTMRLIEEADTAETAACLGLTEANVKVRLHRARELLKERIDAQIGAGVRKVYQFDGDRCDRIVRSVLERLARLAGPQPRSDDRP